MLDRLVDWLIIRRQKELHMDVSGLYTPEKVHRRVMNTIREHKITTWRQADGIYIRFAGDPCKGQMHSEEWIKVKSL